jgi:hypothetical protein
MISWLTDLLYYWLGFSNSSLALLDKVVQFYLILSILAGILCWLVYYWGFNTEYFGSRWWWAIFGGIFSLIVFFLVQYEISLKVSNGDIPGPTTISNTGLIFSNLFFFLVCFSTYFLFSAVPQLRGHRLKRIPF